MPYIKDFYKLVVLVDATIETMANIPQCEILAIQSFKYCLTHYKYKCFNNLPITIKKIYLLCFNNEEEYIFKNKIIDLFKLPFDCDLIISHEKIKHGSIRTFINEFTYTIPKDIFLECKDDYAIFNCKSKKNPKDTHKSYFITEYDNSGIVYFASKKLLMDAIDNSYPIELNILSRSDIKNIQKINFLYLENDSM